jgi:hypothetical protein
MKARRAFGGADYRAPRRERSQAERKGGSAAASVR